MQLTRHGTERILDRTRMLPGDVLSIIGNKAAVDLGTVDGRSYFLFFSPFDQCTKIAIVSKDLTILISVWEKDFHCPDGIQKVTPELEMKARDALKQFLFAKFKAQSPRKESSLVSVTLKVYIGNKPVYQCDGGEIPSKDARTLDAALKALMPKLTMIATIIENNKKKSEGRVRYFIGLSDADTLRPIRHNFVRHNSIMKRIKMSQSPA
jgi:hypothetical protein